MTFRSDIVTWILMCLLGWQVASAQDQIHLTVLSSRRHQWGRSDNPVIGLFVSTDAGVSWEHRGWRQYIRTFSVHTAADGTIWLGCGNGALRSTDNGATWRITTGWEITEVLVVRTHPADPRRVYAATAYGLVVSTDAGETWQARTTGLRRRFTSDVCVDRSVPGHLLIATELGIFKSRDNGKIWLPALQVEMDIRTVVQHPVRPNEFWAGTEENGVIRSTDGGTTWQQANLGLVHMTVYTIAFAPDTIYLGTHAGGVYRSSDNGATWHPVNSGLTNLDVHSILPLRSRPGTVLAGTLNGGLFRSTNGGETWEFAGHEEGQVWGMGER